MTASYVLVTAAAVILVEAIAIAFTIPSLLANQDLVSRVVFTAQAYGDAAAASSASSIQLVLPSDYVLGQPDPALGPGQVKDQTYGLEIPQIVGVYPDGGQPVSMALVLSPDGHVLATSYPARYPVGGQALNVLPNGPKSLESGSGGQISSVSGGRVAWAVVPVVPRGKPLGSIKNLGAYVYVQAPVQRQSVTSFAAAEPLILPGLVVLLLAVPVGTVFGLLTTRGVVRRLRRLAGTTASFADGDFAQRVAPGAPDEVGRLERNFNEMATRLAASVEKQKQLAELNARIAERSRISRDLHDSISQDLFSLSLLSAGLEKALPADSAVRQEVEALAETVRSTNREMRALLLELRPSALDEKGLVSALEDLATTYSARLGVKVDTDLEVLSLPPAAEVAALRIAQEGLANAIKHSRATSIRLGLHRKGDFAEVTVADDGQGFSAHENGASQGLGLRLMRERVDELGGTLTIESHDGVGTTVSAKLPLGSA